MNVAWAYAAFVVVAAAAFWLWTPRVALLVVLLGGWVALPVGHYPAAANAAGLPYWIIGTALPSDMLFTKAWIAPLVAFAGVLIVDRRSALEWRPCTYDAPVVLFCAWPLIQHAIGLGVTPAPIASTLYLLGSWGLPWCLGRCYFASPPHRILLVQGLVWSGLALLPIALAEGVIGPFVYDAVYGPHPFRNDGDVRYLGFRPLALFENGNQYGLWICLCALAATWCWRAGCLRGPVSAAIVALTLLVMAVASQSVGAIVLLAAGLALLAALRYVRPLRLATGVLVVAVLGGAVYGSGVVPVTQIAKETVAGRAVLDAFRAAGRNSFTWRIARDQQALAQIRKAPLMGAGRWDWWRDAGARPWGLVLLLVGQFGLLGALAALSILVAPVFRAAATQPAGVAWRVGQVSIVLAILVVLALIDMVLNSFIFFPAIVAAGSLAANARTEAST